MTNGRSGRSAIRRGDVYDARLDPVEGSEQAGTRPVVIVSRNAINASSRVVLAVPFTTFRGQRIYPSQVLIAAPHGGLTVDSIAQTEQLRALATTRLTRRRGFLPPQAIAQIERAMTIALDLPLPSNA